MFEINRDNIYKDNDYVDIFPVILEIISSIFNKTEFDIENHVTRDLNKSILNTVEFYINQKGLVNMIKYFSDFNASYLLMYYFKNKPFEIVDNSMHSSLDLIIKQTFNTIEKEGSAEINDKNLSALFTIGYLSKRWDLDEDLIKSHYNENWIIIKRTLNDIMFSVYNRFALNIEVNQDVSHFLQMVYFKLYIFNDLIEDLNIDTRYALYNKTGWVLKLDEIPIVGQTPNYPNYVLPFNDLKDGFKLNEYKHIIEIEQNYYYPFELKILSDTDRSILCKVSKIKVPNTSNLQQNSINYLYFEIGGNIPFSDKIKMNDSKIRIVLELNLITINDIVFDFNQFNIHNKFKILMNSESIDSVLKIKLSRVPYFVAI